ncbi:hypothetical protein [Stackebrandtia nassauensis]|uniref:Uncharacterized protein n=1 Tax=Stackebrandtia nassauensis (strain DSM 44728 / CIP 108903 / NRRL B-16338 / NBRC 102104 / LLR-40K-21) TaxID=446470 RepID=D3Q4K2_STANL|nr:hypothetical protein [Stackebrandtia nassauensis]ADD40162.1 hypothetical protein Snas_0447 [Stackebrandtia nassauensis DSM 44728]
MTWPIIEVHAGLRWSLPPLALAALLCAATDSVGSNALGWTVTAAPLAALAHATHWAIRAGSRGWRAIGRVPRPQRITLTAGLGLGASGLTAVIVSVWTASTVLAASGLVAGLALWPVLAYEWAPPPFKKRLLSPLPRLGRPSRE